MKSGEQSASRVCRLIHRTPPKDIEFPDPVKERQQEEALNRKDTGSL